MTSLRIQTGFVLVLVGTTKRRDGGKKGIGRGEEWGVGEREVWEGGGVWSESGRSSREVTILLRGLAFAYGVALSKDQSFVLVDETTACRILRLWLAGPNVGNFEVFADLPGFADNIRTKKELKG